ncbi:DUF4124 domain-containing protein [Halieaceae bacterium IMCC14734]|uniref:DUF4124 domain-containing protein n=1 Tax=Candidatus Litorirhabdus singularis TaxID=2518993 RepID=A0ABT3TCK6_9GAMM|nr:DUF4124 domain-containing protein [Candidatus Litorirhabdus singularis]MCX2979565.1 DUF4124 domain-containing protein [Candidatus Litorirhabdus singularis]
MKWFLLLIVLALPCQAEIFKWVDENGKTHFGDRVPEQYQEKADNVEVNIRQPTAAEIAEAEQRNSAMSSSRQSMESSSRSTRSSKTTDRDIVKQHEKKYDSDYDRQMAEYNASKSCYAGCQVRTPKSPLVGGTFLDNSNCGHCKSVKKPSR